MNRNKLPVLRTGLILLLAAGTASAQVNLPEPTDIIAGLAALAAIAVTINAAKGSMNATSWLGSLAARFFGGRR